MGLDTSHGCWHGAYSAFMRWRRMLAQVANLPPLDLMEGFYSPINSTNGEIATIFIGFKDKLSEESIKRIERQGLPIKWSALKDDPLHELLHHSDCDGEIPWQSCAAIADRLECLLPLLPDEDAGGHIGIWREKTQAFIDGLRLAHSKQENVDFY